ncbi:hypothetical protein FUA23_12165 [Neolewinella aurantiaca]|uniref:Uncharacterized protein n=1 Tax=Neolewinella aurantiaca TaxID=2602767 RepID=A0A5C7FH82_9BACT|nr:hypothetical protein [Neolewinella aurantiaca]TXF89035.1 hypothetical protein FUA23_12165 [Neolewinella aurantiaca]
MQRFIFLTLFACALLSTGCGTAQNVAKTTESAAENRQNRGNKQAELDAEIKALGLSEDQAATYREINSRYNKELKDLRRNAGTDREKVLAEGGKLRAAREREIFDMLDDEQREKFNAIKDERKAEMRKRQRVRRPEGK